MTPFLNPIITPLAMSDIIDQGLQDLLTPDLLRDLQKNVETTTLKYVKTFKVDSTQQGLPVFSLTCSIKTNETSGINANSYRRFDWITVPNGNMLYT